MLNERDKVHLLIKNLKTRKKYKKLNNIKVKSYFIKAKRRIVNYECKLVKNIKVYLIFYILLLELADTKISIQDVFCYQV